MSPIPVIAIFDIGKTNKKLFLFDEHYRIVFERTTRYAEITDDDGDACEDLEKLSAAVINLLEEIVSQQQYLLKAVNFSTYGASFVHVDENGKPVTPLYNYLKPYPPQLQQQFYSTYGGEEEVSYTTASPVSGHLNSGMQLYWLKHCKPHLYNKIKYSLHLPQYMSFLVAGKYYSDITSIGCHTNLWNFKTNDYHEWVYAEGIDKKLAPMVAGDHVISPAGCNYKVGVGLHDSSAALIPYLVNFSEPFILLSTGTWSISLNPFTTQPLTGAELACDCLCYFTYDGRPVKASRLFAGNEHEIQIARIAKYYNLPPDFYLPIEFDLEIAAVLNARVKQWNGVAATATFLKRSLFSERDLYDFQNAAEAYHQLMLDIVHQQFASTNLVLRGTNVKRIFVDGGFSKNNVFMKLLASVFPHLEVYAASMAQATAVGTALAIHPSWNSRPVPNDLVQLRYYSGQ